MTLLDLGEAEAAVGHFRAMLQLNPNDNQGVRYLLLAVLLEQEAFEALGALLDTYDGDDSPWWAYTRLLLAFRAGRGEDPAVRAQFREARKINPHVPRLLSRPAPPVPSDAAFLTVGGEDEAAEYVAACGAAWRRTPGAIAWLATLSLRPGRASGRRASKQGADGSK